jgi:hypothetical protein
MNILSIIIIFLNNVQCGLIFDNRNITYVKNYFYWIIVVSLMKIISILSSYKYIKKAIFISIFSSFCLLLGVIIGLNIIYTKTQILN